MRILIIRNHPSYMDVKNNTYNIQEVGLAKSLVRLGNTCDIVFWTDGEEEDVTLPVLENNGEVHVFYRNSVTVLKNTFYKNIDELISGYDVIQTAEYCQIQSWLLAKKHPEKTIVYHGSYYAAFNKRFNLMTKAFDLFFLKKYIKKQTKFIVKSHLAASYLNAKKIDRENIYTIGVGIDAEMLKSRESSEEDSFFDQLYSDSADKLLYIGRLEPRRNIFFLLDVLREAVNRNSNTRLYIVGNGEPDYKKRIWEYANSIGISDNIVYKEKLEQNKLSKIYERCDFLLLPTRYEIFGMVLLEAMYFKCIAITTHNGGSEMLISNNKDGIIIEAESAKQWADVIEYYLSHKQEMEAMKQAASRKIRMNYTWDALAPSFIEAYKSVINKYD